MKEFIFSLLEPTMFLGIVILILAIWCFFAALIVAGAIMAIQWIVQKFRGL